MDQTLRSIIALLTITLICTACGSKGAESTATGELANNSSAETITFDSTNLALSGTNVQTAIEELAGDVQNQGELIAALENSTTLNCADDMISIHNAYCIEKNQNPVKEKFPDAVYRCALRGRTLCSPAQWIGACKAFTNGDIDGLANFLSPDTENRDWEWVDTISIGKMDDDQKYNLAAQLGGSIVACHQTRLWPDDQDEDSDYPSASSFRCCK
jgi:hypothetical protein